MIQELETLAWKARERLYRFLLACGLPLFFATAPLAGCTAAQRATAATVISDVAAGVPLVCVPIDGADPSASSACSTGASDASSVAKLIASILAGLPAADRELAAADLTPCRFVLHSTVVELPTWQAKAVLAKLGSAS